MLFVLQIGFLGIVNINFGIQISGLLISIILLAALLYDPDRTLVDQFYLYTSDSFADFLWFHLTLKKFYFEKWVASLQIRKNFFWFFGEASNLGTQAWDIGVSATETAFAFGSAVLGLLSLWGSRR